MLKVGITGGIGSGKSLVCKMFSVLGVPSFDADTRAKELYVDTTLREKLITLLGEDIYIENVLQRSVMAAKIFSNQSLLEKVNSLVHPMVKQLFERWAKNQKAPYVLLETAILFESGFWQDMDKVITVNAPEMVRIQRVKERNGLAEETIRQRMHNQWTDKQRASKADFVIMNNEDQKVLPQVLQIHQQLLHFK